MQKINQKTMSNQIAQEESVLGHNFKGITKKLNSQYSQNITRCTFVWVFGVQPPVSNLYKTKKKKRFVEDLW